MQASESASERFTDEMAEMHHRFSNTLQMVRALLSREARRNAGTSCADVLGKAEAQILAFALLHEHLRETRRSEGRDDVCAGTYLDSVCRHLEDACLRPRGIRLALRVVGTLACHSSACRTIGLIVTELVLNAAKHAFGSDSAGHVFVGIERDDRTGGLRLVIADDGAGLPDVAADHSGGLAIVEVLSRSLEADCRCTTGAEGTSFEFSIPASAEAWVKR